LPLTRHCVRHAKRGGVEENLSLGAFVARCEPYLAGTGGMIDQAYQPRLPDGMVGCYVVGDRVAGFGEQLINALLPGRPWVVAERRAATGTSPLLPAEPLLFFKG